MSVALLSHHSDSIHRPPEAGTQRRECLGKTATEAVEQAVQAFEEQVGRMQGRSRCLAWTPQASITGSHSRTAAAMCASCRGRRVGTRAAQGRGISRDAA